MVPSSSKASPPLPTENLSNVAWRATHTIVPLMFALNGIDLYNPESLYVLRSNLVLLLIATIGAVPLARNVYERISGLVLVRAVVMPAFYVLILTISITYVVDSSFNPFLYFRF